MGESVVKPAGGLFFIQCVQVCSSVCLKLNANSDFFRDYFTAGLISNAMHLGQCTAANQAKIASVQVSDPVSHFGFWVRVWTARRCERESWAIVTYRRGRHVLVPGIQGRGDSKGGELRRSWCRLGGNTHIYQPPDGWGQQGDTGQVKETVKYLSLNRPHNSKKRTCGEQTAQKYTVVN